MNGQPNVSSQVYGGLTTIVRILVFVFIGIGILLLARIIFLFFGSLKTVPGYEQVMTYSDVFIKPLGSIESVNTPYDGIFDIAATGGLLIALVLEFVLASVQNFLEKQIVKSRAPQLDSSMPESEMAKTEDELVKK